MHVALTRAKQYFNTRVPKRFYVSQQQRSGDRHDYDSVTRFIPPAVAAQFESVGPARPESSQPAKHVG